MWSPRMTHDRASPSGYGERSVPGGRTGRRAQGIITRSRIPAARLPCPSSERIRAAITVPATDRRTGTDAVITLTTSIGAAVFPDHRNDLTALLPAVDGAGYRAKDSGRDHTVTAKSQ